MAVTQKTNLRGTTQLERAACSSRLRRCPWPTSRVSLLLVLAIGSSVLACLQATGALAARVAFVPAFSTGNLGEGTTLNAELTFTGSEYHGSPQPITEVVVHLPAGVGDRSAGFPTCSELVLEASGPSGCPVGSLAGPVGRVAFDRDIEENGVVTRVHESGIIQPVFVDPEEAVEKAELLFYLEAPGLDLVFPAYYGADIAPYGRLLTLKVPLVETIPAQPLLSFTSFIVTLGASREEAGGLISSLSIPAECPASGAFRWAADVMFYTAASPTPVTAETTCPPPSGKFKEEGGGSGGDTNGLPRVSCCDTPVNGPFSLPSLPISNAQLATLLKQQLVPHGRTATIGSILKHGGLTMPFVMPEAGTLNVNWFLAAGNRTARSASKPELIASGRLVLAAARTGQLRLRLTAAGKRQLRRVTRAKLTAQESFVPTGGVATGTGGSFTLTR